MDVTIAVTDLNDNAPVITSNSSLSIAENTAFTTATAVYSATGITDVAGDSITWSLKDNNSDDAGLFNIDSSGVVTFKQATTPDHEDKESYSFTIVAETGDLSSEKVVTIAVTDLNDNAPVITSDSSLNIAENTAFTTTTVFYTATATPDVAGDSIAWSLKDNNSDDAGLFSIDASGVVTFKSATTPDHERGKTSYAFTIVATTGNLSSEQEVTIAVTDVNEAPTINSSDRGAALTENEEVPVTQNVYTAQGTYDLVPIVWSIDRSKQDDGGFFTIDSGTGEVTFKSATTPDYEAKDSYSFTVVATTGGLSSEKTVTIALTIAPLITSSDSGTALAENTEVAATTVIYTATATPDVAGDGVAWFLKSDNDDDAGLFDINRMTGVVTFKQATTPNHEDKESYSFTIMATTGNLLSLTSEKVVTIAVTDVNDEAPVFVNGTPYAITIYDRSTTFDAVTYQAVPDVASVPVSYKIEAIAGKEADVDSFQIDATTGVLTAAPNVEFLTATKSSYAFDLVITAGNLTNKLSIFVTVAPFDQSSFLSALPGKKGDVLYGEALGDEFLQGTGLSDIIIGGKGVDKIIFLDENDIDQPILTLNDFLYDDNSPLIRGIYPTGSTYPTLDTIVIEFQGNGQKLTINLSSSNRYVLPRYDEEQPTDANNGFLLKSYASFAPFMGGTDTVEFYEIDNLPANVDLI